MAPKKSNKKRKRKTGRSRSTERDTYSGFVLTFEPARTYWLAGLLRNEKEIKESFSAIDWKFERKELVVLVLDVDPLSVSAIGMMERMHGGGGSGKVKMRIHSSVIFDPPIKVYEFSNVDLPSQVCTPGALSRISSRDWDCLVAELRNLRPSLASEIDELLFSRSYVRRDAQQSIRVERLHEQRDALGMVLDIAQVDRAPVLRKIRPEDNESARSVLDLLDALPVQERSLVEHDSKVIERLLGKQPLKSAIFANGNNRRDRTVRVYVSDKTNLESVLGIDLLVYIACFESFLLLQYKRMEKSAGGWAFQINPSSNIHSQLESMSSFRAAYQSNQALPFSPTLWSFRLSEEPFYFKFCEQPRINARDDSLISGITLSEMHLREFLLTQRNAVPGMGQSVGYHNCPRYLSNTEFIHLAREGWIGAGQGAAKLLKKVLAANRKGGRAAMLAVIDTPSDESASRRHRAR